MTYLDIARSAKVATKETKEVRTRERDATTPDDERNECDEKSPALLMPTEAEFLKAEIIAAATVPCDRFDRRSYDGLWARWHAHETAGGAA